MSEEKEKLNFLISLIKNLNANFPESRIEHRMKYLNEPEYGTQNIPLSDIKEVKLTIKFWR